MMGEESAEKSDSPTIMTLVITGPVGVGKTSVSISIASILSHRGVPHALVDMDWLRECSPAPEGDPFQMALGLRNLAAIWANFREAGATCLILADVVETREQRHDYEAAVPGAAVRIVRLKASVPTIHRRLEGRESGDSLAWHKHRAIELAGQMDRDAIEDLLVDTEGKTVDQISAEVLERAGWPAG